ncbi:Panacea domain-containing protein [Mesobacillus stamsii]|uniref:Phage-associated protein n=1 Tax=Mesobacillus stamsii TaxID=225347 RepID=A0ABU0FS46_9BACI|nr:type II toxin-antitoxin system antitoxin SocA domain-containing protein [Mesobacillus stamsii]MDQ0412745.1 putative phage-associated protein [Mesobacillus stamsii]
MAAFHFIAIMSHYQRGTRIGWHYSSMDMLDKEVINSFFSKVKKRCGDVHFGIHKLSTESPEWSSVVKKDKFFADVFITEEMDTFIDYVSADQELTANDVAKFLLTLIPSSHLKLQKLLYYCYAEFLSRTGQKLFDESFVAYKYGPVVESVFSTFRSHGSSIIDYQEDATFLITTKDIATTPSFIKVASSEHGLVALDCIIDVLKAYGDMAPFDLVDKTHQVGGPWDRVYKPGQNSIISDESIIQYHDFAR